MKHESSKSRLNYQKKKQIKGKSEKFASVFIKNKANFVNFEIRVTPFETGIYEILPAGSGKKTNPIKPNSNPIAEKAIIIISSFLTSKYEKVAADRAKKQTQTNPIQSQSAFYRIAGE